MTINTVPVSQPVVSNSNSTVGGPLLEVNPHEFENCFTKRPFLVKHRLCDHPLFTMERILELSQRLPESCIEYNAGNIPISVEEGLTPRNGLSPEETIRRIEECKSWLVLKYVEKDPAYRELLEECLQVIRPYSEPIAPGMTQPQAFLFVSSPGSVTPFHVDPEHNFLLQIRGNKEVRMLDGHNSEIVTQETLENFYSDRGRNLKLRKEHVDAGWTYDLQPGQGLHFPVTFPHWVKNGESVSISFSITFRTPDLDRRRALYQANAELRGRGWKPWAVGKSFLRDNIVYQSFRLKRKFNQLFAKSSCSEQDARSCGMTKGM
ncbi:JmjC domain-containing protein [Planctomicrobium sp. SH668]|uniref:JmjC domain-containing protein n=1 Tax=Planctomicrobium sp. SH668 TaxID=3448126 RepID=UPI003F5B29D5